LKAFLYAQGEESLHWHSVDMLARRCAEYDRSAEELAERIKELDRHYIQARYPNGLPDNIPARFYTANHSEQAIRQARQALEWVSQRLAAG